VEEAVNRSNENATRVTNLLSMCIATCASILLAACNQGPGGGGIGLASGQDPDPATVDFPIFYIRHQVPTEQDDLRRQRPFVEDDDVDDDEEVYTASLWKRDRASPGAPETNITARLASLPGADPDDRYDIKDLNVSPDGLKVAFAMRGPLQDIDDEEDPPTWHIWEYNIATDVLHRVITSDIIAEEGQDVAPAYLPDGRILFSSTRQRQAKAILLDEGKAQFEAANESRTESAFVLHVMNADGTNIRQISFNPSSDLTPTVLQNGRVLWTRWDNAPGRNGMHLYTSNPDGTDMQLHYGAVSHMTGTLVQGQPTPIQFVRAREMSNNRIMVMARQTTGTDFGGNLLIIDTNTYVENTQPTLPNAGLLGPAQVPATLNNVSTVPGPSEGGRFQSGFPLWDGSGRILVSWSQCRLFDTTGPDPTRIIPCTAGSATDPNAVAAPPLYSIWMFNPSQNTILPIMPPVEGVMVTDAVAAQPRVPLPAVILDKVAPLDLDPDLVADGAGLLSIRSVYDVMGQDTARLANGTASNIQTLANPASTPATQRPIRFIRIEKPVSIPDDDDIADPDNSAFGPTGVMREIVAYAPVEPDGSVRMKIPANVPFQMTLLDENARRVSVPHRAWLQVRPGEVVECNGCHVRQAAAGAPERVHGRKFLFTAVYSGATSTGVAFPGTTPTITPDQGDTMARARSRPGSSCPDATMTEHCGLQSVRPSADVIYDEIWAPGAPPTASFAYNYSLLTTPSPASVGCFPVWSATCRITIHYADVGTRRGHIMPLWSANRQVLDPVDGVTVLEDNTCTTCHNRVDAAGAVQLPAASLELQPAQCNEEPMYDNSYCQLFRTRPQLQLNMGAVEPIPGPLDANGNPTAGPTFPPSMSASNARGSRFFTVMNNATHAGMLTSAELRLLSEWLDIGAQYYNDPFPPTPQN
jgi:hypothetical protein